MTAAERLAAFKTHFEQVTGRMAELTDFATFKITQAERTLNNDRLLDDEIATVLTRLCPRHDPAEVRHVMKLHEELLSFLPPDAVPSVDEESEHEALAYELYVAIKAMVTAR
jgi:hypothetical protein